MNNLRSMLFMPGNNPGMLVSADQLGADAIIYDLEDAVSLGEKDSARELVKNALINLAFEHSFVTVRMNPIDSPYWQDDLDAILPAEPDGIVIPKASVEAVQTVEKYVNDFYDKQQVKEEDRTIRFLLLIEDAAGIINADKIAASTNRADALLLGGEDYSVSMGVDRTDDSKELEYARFRLATCARAFHLDALDTPFTDINDEEGLKKDTAFSKQIGFNGRLVINPRQIPAIHRIFTPSQEKIEDAQIVLQAAEDARKNGKGVFSFRGKMVDKPVISRAENLVKAAKEWGLL